MNGRTGGAIVAAAFFGCLGGAVLAGRLPTAAVGWYAVVSVAAFGVYAHDKSAARRNRWRVPENTLHLLGLIGGWPGGLLAQQILRHKTRKVSFQVIYWFTVVLNVAGICYVASRAMAGAG